MISCNIENQLMQVECDRLMRERNRHGSRLHLPTPKEMVLTILLKMKKKMKKMKDMKKMKMISYVSSWPAYQLNRELGSMTQTKMSKIKKETTLPTLPETIKVGTSSVRKNRLYKIEN